MRVALAGFIISSTLLLAASVEARPSVAYIRLVDTTGTAHAKLTEELELAFSSDERIRYVSYEEVAAVARRFKIPKSRWLDKDAVGTLAGELGVDFFVVARLSLGSRWSYDYALYGVDTHAKKRVAVAVTQFSVELAEGTTKPALSRVKMTQLVRDLVRKLPAPALPAPKEEPVGEGEGEGEGEDSWSDEGWGSDEGWAETPAEDSPSENTTGSVFADLTPELGGRVRAESFLHVLEGEELPGRNQAEVAVRVSIGDDRAGASGTFLARHDFADPTRDRFDVEEAWVEAEVVGVKLRAGRLMHTWGTANLFNPTDVLNPFDYRDLIDTEKRGAWSARASWSVGVFGVDLTYLPIVEPHLLPLPDRIEANGSLIAKNRWVTGRVDIDDDPGIPLRFQFRDSGPPPATLSSSQFAARARVSVLGLDASVGYAWLYDRYPTLRTTAEVASPLPLFVDVDVRTEYLRRHLITADFEYAIGKLRFAGEGLFVLTEDLDGSDDEIDNPYAQGVVGVDWQSPAFLDTHYFHLFLDFTAARALVGTLPDDPVGRVRFPLPLGTLARVEYHFGELGHVEVSAAESLAGIIDDTDDPLAAVDLLIRPAVKLRFYDLVSVELAGLWLAGHGEGFFGRYGAAGARDNTRVEAAMEVAF